MNKQALLAAMREKGVSITDMYKTLRLSRSAFYRKCNGISEFTLKEITQIMDVLEIRDPSGIFFSEKVS